MAIVVVPNFDSAIAATCQAPATTCIKAQARDGGLAVSFSKFKYGISCFKVPQFHHLMNRDNR